MSDPFIGEIKMFGGNFAPRDFAFCDGQLLPIAQNTALFSLLGTMYGGDGRTTFALPDLRSRVPIGQGQGPGLSPRSIGETVGSPSVTLLASQLPPHGHAQQASTNAATAAAGPSGAHRAVGGDGPVASSTARHSSALQRVAHAAGAQGHAAVGHTVHGTAHAAAARPGASVHCAAAHGSAWPTAHSSVAGWR